MNQAGLVVIAMAGLWIAYLVPHRLRYRQQLLESRTDDRFSEQLRVVCVAGATPTGGTPVRQVTAQPRRVLLHLSGRGSSSGGGGRMNRPQGTVDRTGADVARRAAAERARRAAYLAHRQAAARRRTVLTAVLALLAVAGWTAVTAAGAAVALAVVPTVLLLATLLLARRAVVAGRRADARWAADHPGEARLTGRTTAGRPPAAGGAAVARRQGRAVGRAVHPSNATTQVLLRVPGEARVAATVSVDVPAGAVVDTSLPVDAASTTSTGSSTAGEQAASAASDAPVATLEVGAEVPADSSSWAPVPVPRPTYTLKPAAPRREPAPLVIDEQPAPAAGSDGAADAPVAAHGDAPVAAHGATPVAPSAAGTRPGPVTGGLDLDAILARRRASGE